MAMAPTAPNPVMTADDRSNGALANGALGSRPLEFAVVGYGNWGSKHTRVLAHTPDVAVTVVDRDPTRLAEARRAFPMIKVSDSLDATLATADAVVIATPPRSHAVIAHAAIRAGCHVLGRKAAGHNGRGMRRAHRRRHAQRRVVVRRSHVRARRRDLEVARDREQRRARRDSLHRLRASQPRPVPGRRATSSGTLRRTTFRSSTSFSASRRPRFRLGVTVTRTAATKTLRTCSFVTPTPACARTST